MRFSFDLSPGQSDRVIDQAVRHHTVVHLEPQAWTDGRSLKTTLCRCDRKLLVTESASQDDQLLQTLVDMYVNAQMTLGQTLYLFASHVVDVEWRGSQALLLLARPETLMVPQRRRFQRMTLPSACQVHLSPERAQAFEPVIARLLNLSPEGMACRLTETEAAPIRQGHRLRVAFHPDEAERSFNFLAVLSNKSRAGSPGHLILGLHFQVNQHDHQAQAERQRLRDFLYATPRALATQGA